MKFELKPYNRNASEEDFINDLKKVSLKLQKDSISTEEYNKFGRYHSSTIQRRFKSWTKALKRAGLQIRKYPKLIESELLEDLKRVAEVIKKKSVTQAEYESFGKYSPGPFIRTFGSWFKALEKAGLEKTRNFGVTEEEYFKNLEEIWIKLGRQPNYAEIEKPFSKYSAGAYEYRFGTWHKALEAFVKYVNEETHEDLPKEGNVISRIPEIETKNIQHKTKKNISWRLRFVIMHRDNFKCKKCGGSPSSDPKVKLHVDHIKPYSKGGETVPENLETLCMECNIGKSDLEFE